MPRLVPALALLALATPAVAQELTLESTPTRWRVELSQVETEQGDDLGWIGLHYDVLEPIPRWPEIYVGVGGYGAVSGDRGGLFVGGLTLGFLREIGGRWFFDAGVFAGGGGGASTEENSGLMLRPHIGIERAFRLWGLRLEAATVDFPDGDIDDSYVALGFSLLSESLRGREGRRGREIPDAAVLPRQVRLTPQVALIDPSSSSRRRNGQPLDDEISLLGVGLDYFLTPHLYLPLEAYGAGGGGVDGFAMGFTGLGWSVPFLSEDLRLEAEALAGAGGGGDVDTGGGLLWSVRGGLRTRVWRAFDLELGAGYLDAPDGELEGAMLIAGVGWSGSLVGLHPDYPRSALQREALPSDKARVIHPQVLLLHKSYSPPSDVRKPDGSELDNMRLLGLGLDVPLTSWLVLTGRSYGAYAGDAGGYAEGLIGGQYELRPLSDRSHVFVAGAELGVAGGGGVPVDSGLIYEFSAGYRYEWTERISFVLEAGKVEADQGSFEAEMYLVGVRFDLALPVLR